MSVELAHPSTSASLDASIFQVVSKVCWVQLDHPNTVAQEKVLKWLHLNLMIQALFRCPFNSLQWLQCIVFGCFCLLLSYYGNFSHGDTGCFGTKLLEKPRVPNKRSTMGALGASGLGRSREFVEKINCWIGFRDLMYLYLLSIYYRNHIKSHQITSNHIKSPDLMVPDPRAASKSLPNS